MNEDNLSYFSKLVVYSKQSLQHFGIHNKNAIILMITADHLTWSMSMKYS